MSITWVKSKGRKLLVLDHAVLAAPRSTEAIEVAVQDLRFEFRFFADEASDPRVNASVEDKKLVMNFINFNSGLATAWDGQVGTLGGKTLFLAVTTSVAGDFPDESRSFGYTFYVEEL